MAVTHLSSHSASPAVLLQVLIEREASREAEQETQNIAAALQDFSKPVPLHYPCSHMKAC